MKSVVLAFSVLAIFSSVQSFASSFGIDDFAHFGIHATVEKKTDPRMQNLGFLEDRYFLEVKLGRLSREQFSALMENFGNKSAVAYDSSKEYDLIDFLLPAMQATVNQVFVPRTYDTSKLFNVDLDSLGEETQMKVWWLQKMGVSSFANCWNTTIELLGFLHPSGKKNTYQIYWPGRWSSDEELKRAEISDLIPAEEASFGDVLLVSNLWDIAAKNGMLQHTAMILSDSLVFEKTDASADDAYRISLRKDVLAKYREMIQKKDLVIEYRRYNLPGKKAFDEPLIATPRETVDTKDIPILEEYIPNVLDLPLVAGCETGMGGGCDTVHSVYLEFKVVTNPKTGRGIFLGPRKELDRFQPLIAAPL